MKLSAYVFLIPSLFFFLVFMIYPIAFTLYTSFFEYQGAGIPTIPTHFAGLKNYEAFFVDPVFISSITNTLIWIALSLTAPILLALGLALVLDSSIKGEVVFKSIFFLPVTFSAVSVGLMWRWIYDSYFGALNATLRMVGLDSLARAWLGIPVTNTFAMVVASSWATVGFAMLLFLAGLRSIPQDLIEVSELDGASSWQRFRLVIIPLLSPFTSIALGMSLLNTLKVFDIIFTMTEGGPFRTSETLAFNSWREAFQYFDYGYGSAIATLLFLIALIITFLYLRFSKSTSIY